MTECMPTSASCTHPLRFNTPCSIPISFRSAVLTAACTASGEWSTSDRLLPECRTSSSRVGVDPSAGDWGKREGSETDAGGRDESESAMEGPALVSCAFRDSSRVSCCPDAGEGAGDDAAAAEALSAGGAAWSTGVVATGASGAGGEVRHGVHDNALLAPIGWSMLAEANMGRLPSATAEGCESQLGPEDLRRIFYVKKTAHPHAHRAHAARCGPRQPVCCSRQHL